MSHARVSTVFGQSIDRVWAILRDFNSLPMWLPAVARSEIENEQPSDKIGVIRRLYLRENDVIVREKIIGSFRLRLFNDVLAAS